MDLTTAPAPATPAPSRARPPAPWFGRPWEHRQAAIALVGSVAACTAYWAATRVLAPDLTPGWLEFAGTATSLWAVWITQRRNVLAMPVGIVSVLLMGAFFWQIGLIGQAGLHWGYYLVVQLWGWRHWTRGGEAGGELAVGRLTGRQRLTVLAAVLVGTLLVRWVLTAGWADAVHATWDASIVAASVLAQLLLSAKKVESWWLWILPVDVSAIGLYVATGASMFAALYVLFLVMAVVGLVRWHRAATARTP
jgi:nicotinamide mononucleotide transporter